MTIEMDREAAGRTLAPQAIETALRWLAVRKDGEPLRYLRYAIEDPASSSAVALGCLVEPTASLAAATPESRAYAVWGLIVDEIGKLGSADDSRRRNTLMAAFRLPPAPAEDPAWKGTLDDRFRQLVGLSGIFGDPPPTTTTPMHKAWRRAIGKLTDCVLRKLELLRSDGREWSGYVEIGRRATMVWPGDRATCEQDAPGSEYRRPSRGAQPVFIERMVVRVVMHRKMALRRTTERDVIACEDGVDGYDLLASTGRTASLTELPVRAIWACRLVTPSVASPGDPGAPRLRFRKVLRRGDRYHLVSEAWDECLDQTGEWINVDVDHHGIAPGTLDEAGKPTAGLSVQVTFDRECLPEACWWYAEQTDLERRRRPPAGDPHLLEIDDGFVQHTFVDRCQPRENYGVAFRWSRV